MRECDDDNILLYAPVSPRVINLAAVIIAVPVMIWTITTFIRGNVARLKVPTFQHLTLTEAPQSPPQASPLPASLPPAPPPVQTAALARVADARAPLLDASNGPLKGPMLGPPPGDAGAVAGPLVTGTAPSPPPVSDAGMTTDDTRAPLPNASNEPLKEPMLGPPPGDAGAVAGPPVIGTAPSPPPVADARTTTDDALAPLPGASNGSLKGPGDAGAVAGPPVTGTAPSPPLVPPVAGSPPSPAETAPAAPAPIAPSNAAALPTPTQATGATPRLASNSTRTPAAAPGDRGFAWSNANTDSAPSLRGSPKPPATTETASAEELPAPRPIGGRIPLPRHRPSVIAITSTGAWEGTPQPPATTETASAEELPAPRPIGGRIPLPQHRPSVIAITSTGAWEGTPTQLYDAFDAFATAPKASTEASIAPTGPVPLPRARPGLRGRQLRPPPGMYRPAPPPGALSAGSRPLRPL
jgi:hypothetical protein